MQSDKKQMRENVENFRQHILRKFGNKLDDFHIYPHAGNNIVQLGNIVVNPEFRGQGIGSEVLNEFITFCDKNKYTIVLSPAPGKGYKKKLALFYKKFGFVPNRGRDMDYRLSNPFSRTMYRYPKFHKERNIINAQK